MINLGDKVKDVITGLEGIVVGKTEWLNKCVRVTVQPRELKDGKPVDAACFDVEQLELVEAGAVVIKKDKPTGGPRDVESTRRPDVTR